VPKISLGIVTRPVLAVTVTLVWAKADGTDTVISSAHKNMDCLRTFMFTMFL